MKKSKSISIRTRGKSSNEGQDDSGLTAWFENGTKKLVEKAQQKKKGQSSHCGSSGKQRKLHHEVKERSVALSTSSSSVGVSFAGRAFQADYFQTKFARRGILLFRLLTLLKDQEVFRREGILVGSFGGGPGTDAAGFVWAHRQHWPSLRIELQLYDKESTWKYYLETLRGLFQDDIWSLSFNCCDTTKSILAPDNFKICKWMSQIDVFVFAYVCNETSHYSQLNGDVFYLDLAEQLKPDALLIFMDVLGASSPVLDGIITKIQSKRVIQEIQNPAFVKLKSEIRIIKCIS